MFARWMAGACLGAVLAGASVASAEPISLTQVGTLFEDTYPLKISYKYKSSTEGILEITSYGNSVVNLTEDGKVYREHKATFDLTAIIDPATGAAKSGQFAVTADLDDSPKTKNVLLWNSTSLLDFGYTESFDQFQFRFVQQGNTPLEQLQDGTYIGVLVRAGQLSTKGDLPSWLASFKTTAPDSRADEYVAHAPLPSAAWAGLGLLSCVVAGSWVRRRMA